MASYNWIDRRYVLSRRRDSRFERLRAGEFKSIDDMIRSNERFDKRRSIFTWPYVSVLGAWCLLLAGMIFAAAMRDARRPSQAALDAQARERAAAFVQALGFEPGPAVCLAKRDGSALCTIRVADSDKTFAISCGEGNAPCIERKK